MDRTDASPNHVEAFSLCGIAQPSAEELRPAVESACLKLAQLRPQIATIVRAGALGACYVESAEPGKVNWVPAYWSSDDQHKVVDPTGAGNGFMGGLAAALDEGFDVEKGEARSHGSMLTHQRSSGVPSRRASSLSRRVCRVWMNVGSGMASRS